MFRVPSMKRAAKRHGTEKKVERFFQSSSSEKIFEKSQKVIDEGAEKKFARHPFLNGKLFENYFVRLIGTPNQQFKKWITPSGVLS